MNFQLQPLGIAGSGGWEHPALGGGALIYLTGDMHGDADRFKAREVKRLKKNDTLIICGDFGFIWDNSQKEKRLLKWIGRRRYNVVFVEGPHDNLELLSRYPEGEWCGGRVREISGRLRHLIRGETYRIGEESVFAFGGGESDAPVDSRPPWAELALPTRQELDRAVENLSRLNNRVDYIVTHQPSRKIRQFLDTDHHDANVLDTFLDEIRERCTFRQWYFGSLHRDKQIPPFETALFRTVARAEERTRLA